MTHPAIKKYLHELTITKKEVQLIKDLLKDSTETLKDFLPEGKNFQTYFLADLLTNSLKDFKNNEAFIKDILSLKNKDNEDAFYTCLKESKEGLKLLRNNPNLHNENMDEVFLDILQKSSQKDILNFVKENKEKINVEAVYKASWLDLKLVQALEKEGFNFDKRIIPVINNDQDYMKTVSNKNYLKPTTLLKYFDKFESSMNDKEWNTEILTVLRKLDRNIWDWDATIRFKDTIFLLTKLKNPSQYQWSQEVKCGNDRITFNFGNSLNFYLKPNSESDNYIDEKNKDKLNLLRKFIKNNDIHFKELKNNILLFNTFINELSDDVIEKAIKSNWENMLPFQIKTKQPLFNRDSVVISSLHGENPILKNQRVRPIMLKEYFSRENYRLDEFDEKYFFEKLGITEKSIKNGVLKQYYDVLDLGSIKHIAERFDLNRIDMEKELLDYQLPNDKTDKMKRVKI
jgi:hypothetical protein